MTATSGADAPAPGRTRRNRGSTVVRDALVDAAIAEFAAHGFEGASTRRIAEAAGAHQSQIKYHFATKDDLWKRCLDRLIAEVDEAITSALDPDDRSSRAITDALQPDDRSSRAVLEATIRGLVHFAARRPELNRIMIHEATSPSDRLVWLVDTHVGARQAAAARAWTDLAAEGVAAPVAPDALYHTLIGAASLLYANAPEARLMGIEPADPAVIEAHAEALVAMFLPAHRQPKSE